MSDQAKLTVPELGDFEDVEVIEVLVGAGDTVAVEDPLVTLETDKATMDVPASAAGKIVSLDVAVGDKINSGDVVATIEVTAGAEPPPAPVEAVADTGSTVVTETERQPAADRPDTTHYASLVVIGAGPGHFAAPTWAWMSS